MPTLVLRQFLKDRRTLAQAMAGSWPTLEQLRRRALVEEWERTTGLPDQVLRNRRDAVVGGARSEWEILSTVLDTFVREFLLRRDGEVLVRFERFGQWQSEIADLSPLPILAFALWRWYGAPDVGNHAAVVRYVDRTLRPLAHTALVAPFHPQVEDLIRTDGLHDRHIHLNGSTEVDKLWQDQLGNIERAAVELRKALPRLDRTSGTDQSMLAELYEQLDLTPDALYHFLRVARRLRMVLADFAQGLPQSYTLADLVRRLSLPELDQHRPKRRHPLAHVAGQGEKLIPEYLLLILTFARLERDPGAQEMARALYFYLLILNALAVPLTIQSERQKGFDQFQKFTFTNMRSPSEGRSYLDRFHQLNGSPRRDLAVLEGRISPPDNADKLKALLSSILDGLSRYRGGGAIHSLAEAAQAGIQPAPRPGEPRMELMLVAHFIKKADPDLRTLDDESSHRLLAPCRHYGLRLDLKRRWRVLREVRNGFPIARRFLVGVDAAANESHTGPEVFAPLYRAARRAGMTHFTYHAGEDFAHLVSGIRAVAEAVIFLGLRTGDRIGHGTALGIDPALWLDRMPGSVWLPTGEHLDNLVFAHHHLLGGPGMGDVLPRLEDEIRHLSRVVHGDSFDPSLLYAAWRARSHDPLAIPYLQDVQAVRTAVQHDRRREIHRLDRLRMEYPMVFDRLVAYHSRSVRQASHRRSKFDTGWLNAAALRFLQGRILADMVDKQVAIETLPTSNVRISFYQDHAEHHVFRWLEEEPGQAPTVCVGSDDPGIFANSMRAEFYHLARELEKRGDRDWTRTLRRLNDNSRIFGFLPPLV